MLALVTVWETTMSHLSLPKNDRRLQHALLMAGANAGIAAIITFMLAGLVLLIAGLPLGSPYALFTPQLHIVPGMMPRGSLDTAVWLTLISAYSSLLIGLISFVLVYIGRASE
jgi:hypothetical protein